MTNKNVQPARRGLFPVGLGILLVFLIWLDQWTKALALDHLKDQEDIILIPGVFQLKYLENRGAAFGILQDQTWIFLGISVILIAAAVYVYSKMPKTSYYLPLFLVGTVLVAGGVGNSIDRVIRGFVVDFFYFSLIDFPIFNMADIYMVAGCIVLFLLVLIHYKDEDYEFLKPHRRKKED